MPDQASPPVAHPTHREVEHLGVGRATDDGPWDPTLIGSLSPTRGTDLTATWPQPMSALHPKATVCCGAAK